MGGAALGGYSGLGVIVAVYNGGRLSEARS